MAKAAEPNETLAGPSLVEGDSGDRESQASMVDVMREHFKKQRREKIRIPKDAGPQFVQINGYSFQIQAGVFVEVPTDVADLLRNADII